MKLKNITGTALRTVLSTTLLSTSGLAGIAYAQDQAPRTGVGQIEEIVVTARRREESLQDTPIAVSAFSGEGLEERGIEALGTLDTVVPNLVFNEVEAIGGSNAAATIFIRGIGQTDFNQNTEPGVGLYIDNVYVARSVGSAMDLIDLEKVEVLRGPQGTLFGRNTIGGAVSLTTKKPTEDFGGYLAVTGGSDSLVQLKGAVNIPFSENFLTKVTVFNKDRDGYVDRIDGLDLGDDNVFAIRGDFRLHATENLTFDLALEKLRERENGAPVTPINLIDTAPFASFHNFAPPGFNASMGINCAAVPTPGTCFTPGNFLTNDIRRSNGTGPSQSDLDIEGVTFTANWKATDNISIKSITAYRELDSFFATDHDHSSQLIDHTSNDYIQDQFSQELQVNADFDRINLVAGLYYFEETGTDVNDVAFSIGSLRSGGSIENDAFAVFGQVTVDVTEQLHVTGGIRHTTEDKLFVPEQVFLTDFFTPAGVQPAGSPLVIPGSTGELDISETNFLANISYDVTDNILVYGTWSDGFKSGGFTQRLSGPPFTEAPAFQPEFVDVIEIGAKTQFFDNRVRMNMAYFNTDYTDIQLNVLTPGLPNPFTINAADATISGFEAEITAVPIENLEINASLGLLDSEFDSVSGGITLRTVAGDIPVGVGLVDTTSRFVNAPESTASIGVAYNIETPYGSIVPRVDWSHRSGVFNDALNTPELFQPAYDIVNLGLAFTDNEDKWSLNASVSNIFDEEYLITGFADTGAVGFIEGAFARGTEWQVQLRRNF